MWGGKPCTVGGTVGISISNNLVGVTSPLLTSALTSSTYSVIVHVPSSELSLSGNSIPQATLSATTDSGYTSSVVVDLQPEGSAPSTLVSGYTAYTFSVPQTTTLTNWVDGVNSHTVSSSNIASASSTVFLPAGQEGSYTVYPQVSSSQIGTLSVGSASFSDPGIEKGGCTSSPCKNQN